MPRYGSSLVANEVINGLRMAENGASVAITHTSAQPKADEVVRGIESGGGNIG